MRVRWMAAAAVVAGTAAPCPYLLRVMARAPTHVAASVGATHASPVTATQTGGWKQAVPGYRFRFPEDHASHPDYKLEWWYYTGNVATAGGRRFGYQLTFFRVGLDPAPVNPSRWAVRDLFMTHLAVTDIDRGRYVAREKLNRAGIGWAGAATETYRVWNDEWQASLVGSAVSGIQQQTVQEARNPEARSPKPEVTARPHILRARDGDLGLELTLDEGGPPVLHGDAGLSAKGDQAGNASYYYSLTRMPTRGTLLIAGESVAVSGFSWMDHEFGTTILEPHQKGWDWFSMQLDDGTDLMVFQLRDRDGRAGRQSSGTLIPAGGRPIVLKPDTFTLKPGRTWASRESGATYPVEWDVLVPGVQLSVRVRPAVDAQELAKLSTGVTYWEGAVTITGTRAGQAVTGRGYLEMTGYSGRPMGEIMR